MVVAGQSFNENYGGGTDADEEEEEEEENDDDTVVMRDQSIYFTFSNSLTLLPSTPSTTKASFVSGSGSTAGGWRC